MNEQVYSLVATLATLAAALATVVKPAVDLARGQFAIGGRQVLALACAIGVATALAIWLALGGPYTIASAMQFVLGGLGAAGIAATLTATQKRADTIREQLRIDSTPAIDRRFRQFWDKLNAELDAEEAARKG